MNIKILDSKTKIEQIVTGNCFVLNENQNYIVQHKNGEFTEDDFKLLGTYISPELGLLQSTNKIGIYKLKDIQIRFRSKLGDEFVEKIKVEIAEIEKLLLLSQNALEDRFDLTYGNFLDEIALSLFFEEWHKGKILSSLRSIFDNPKTGFKEYTISKNLSNGATLIETDFQNLRLEYHQLAKKSGKAYPIAFKTKSKHETHDIVEMRFIKMFLTFCSNLLKRYITSQSSRIQFLKKYSEKYKNEDRFELDKFIKITEELKQALQKQNAGISVQLNLNKFLNSETLKQVSVKGSVDFTSLKLHNNFHYKFLLNLYLNMRKSFDVLNNTNLIKLGINSLENLYEYYCLIKILESFETKEDVVRKVIRKIPNGWIIDKSLKIDLGVFNNVRFTLYFKKNFIGKSATFSQDYEPDFSIGLQNTLGNISYIHLDAKYKHNNYLVKKEDIDKMHTYAHAIKATKAAFVLFPGKSEVFYECSESIVGALICSPWSKLNLREHLQERVDLC